MNAHLAEAIAESGAALHGLSGARARVEQAHDAIMALADMVFQIAVEAGDMDLIAACFARATEAINVRHELLAALDRHKRSVH